MWLNSYVADDATTEAVFKALADPTRRQILEDLAQGELSAGEVAAHFPISGPSVSRHLSVLRTAGLVSERKVANRVMYSVVPGRLSDCLVTFLSVVCPDEGDVSSTPAKKQAKRRRKEHDKRKRKPPAPRSTASRTLGAAGGASPRPAQAPALAPSAPAPVVTSLGPQPRPHPARGPRASRRSSTTPSSPPRTPTCRARARPRERLTKPAPPAVTR